MSDKSVAGYRDPAVTLEHSITRMAVATEAEAEKQGGDNRTMAGRRMHERVDLGRKETRQWVEDEMAWVTNEEGA